MLAFQDIGGQHQKRGFGILIGADPTHAPLGKVQEDRSALSPRRTRPLRNPARGGAGSRWGGRGG